MEDSGGKKIFEQPISRRELLKMAGAGGIGLLIGGGAVSGALIGGGKGKPTGDAASAGSAEDRVPFYGEHQAGIATPAQDFCCFIAFDLETKRLAEVRELFRQWTEAASRLASGQMIGNDNDLLNAPPSDTGEAIGLSPSRTTITFGVGPSFFDARFGLASRRPAPLADLPSFPGDDMKPQWCGGDIGVQVCANDPQVAFHAMRNLVRIAKGTAVIRWIQEGFQRTKSSAPGGGTPRNLMGFKDGTVNPDIRSAQEMNRVVWAQAADGTPWMANGSYMVVRRIRMRIEVWDRSTLDDQEKTFGRSKVSGAPLGQSNEFDQLDLDKKGEDGKPLIPIDSHVRQAHGDGSESILRRAYSYSNGIAANSGHFDAGLLFICYQRDPRRQFTPIQRRLASNDALNEYIVHEGSALFACFPGVRKGEYIGNSLI